MEDSSGSTSKQLTLAVDDQGRMTLPAEIRERLAVEGGGEVTARVGETAVTITASSLDPATTARDDWEGTMTLDAGRAAFGSLDGDEQ